MEIVNPLHSLLVFFFFLPPSFSYLSLVKEKQAGLDKMLYRNNAERVRDILFIYV